jgi:hypothetical protein
MQIPSSIRNFLGKYYQLSSKEINYYQQNQYIKLKQVLDHETLDFFNKAITERVNVMNAATTPLEERNTYGKAFLQMLPECEVQILEVED